MSWDKFSDFCARFSALSTFETKHAAVPFTSILSIDPLAEAHCNPSRIVSMLPDFSQRAE